VRVDWRSKSAKYQNAYLHSQSQTSKTNFETLPYSSKRTLTPTPSSPSTDPFKIVTELNQSFATDSIPGEDPLPTVDSDPPEMVCKIMFEIDEQPKPAKLRPDDQESTPIRNQMYNADRNYHSRGWNDKGLSKHNNQIH
jgi:hypothetical protein